MTKEEIIIKALDFLKGKHDIFVKNNEISVEVLKIYSLDINLGQELTKDTDALSFTITARVKFSASKESFGNTKEETYTVQGYILVKDLNFVSVQLPLFINSHY